MMTQESIGDIKMTLDIDVDKNIISIHKEYILKEFSWTIEFIFKQGRYSDNDFLEVENKLGKLLDAERRKMFRTLFNDTTYNSAIAISDQEHNRSIIISTQVTSIGQFVNSLTHEILHVSRHIDKCNNNEKLFTLLGNVSGDIIKELYNQ